MKVTYRNSDTTTIEIETSEEIAVTLTESYPVRSHKAALRHAVAKHDPNAGRRDVLLLCDRTYSRKHNRNISNRRK